MRFRCNTGFLQFVIEPTQKGPELNKHGVVSTEGIARTQDASPFAEARKALLSPGARIGVFRALYLGDLLVAIPAIRALRRANPSAHITLIGLPWAHGLAARFPHYMDDFVAVPPVAGLHAGADETAFEAALTAARAQRFDIVIQMHGSGPQSNAIFAAMNAEHVAGYYPAGDLPPGGAFIPYAGAGTEVERNRALVAALTGQRCGDDALELPVTQADRAELRRTLEAEGIEPGRYAVVHAGAKLASRRWPPERFAAVADHLAAHGYNVVLTGSREEASTTAAVSAAMQHAPIDLTGETSLGALAALVEGAELVVCNDTGVAHVAAALHTPSVVIASGSDTARWAASEWRLHRTLAYDIECRPCMHDVCPIGHPCALGITIDGVIAEIDALLVTAVGRAP